MCDVGTGTTVAFSSSTLSGTLTSVGIGEESIPVLDETGLSTTDFREKCFGDLSEPPAITLGFDFASGSGLPALGGGSRNADN